MIRHASWLASGIILDLNDIFMLTVDRKRTNTYLGCTAIQTIANSCFCVISISLGLETKAKGAPPRFPYDYRGFLNAEDAGFTIVAPFVGCCSLCLLGISLSAALAFRSCGSAKRLWKTNTKDAFKGDIPSKITLSVTGHPRQKIITLPKSLVVFSKAVKRCFLHFLFRRISPAETPTYALGRNSFAVVAMGLIIFQTVKAFLQAQNEIETRVTSTTCDDISPLHNVAVLSDRLIYDPRWPITSLPDNVSISTSVIWNNQGGYGTYNITNCTIEWSRPFRAVIEAPSLQTRILELFNCSQFPGITVKYWEFSYRRREYLNSFAFRIDVQPAATAPQRGVSDSQMPHIWLANLADFKVPNDGNWSEVSEIQEYLPPLKLLRGSQILAEANLITRKFITSPIVKDVFFSFKTDYKYLSLYPMSIKSSIAAFNSSDARLATAIIHPTLTPGLMYHRNQAGGRERFGPPMNLCDYIEDYRSSTILDVISSVGGLFALLQSANLLLFGRPLLWGLTGAKTISPFGLLGGYYSRGFRQRLRDEYYSRSDQDETETIRIVKFLRDFVIDFGPADLDLVPVEQSESKTVSHTPMHMASEDSASAQIPLVQMNPDPTDSDVDEGNNRDRIHSTV